MSPIHWTWGAVAADLGLIWSPLMMSTSSADFFSVLLAHGLVSLIAALATYLLLPKQFRQPRVSVTLLMFCFAFVAPVIGAMGLLLITRTQLKLLPEEARLAVPRSVSLPVYDVQTTAQTRGGQSAIRSRMGKEVPNALRMQSLLTLQAVPNRVSNPILEHLLGDTVDDLRLVAFGMLDAKEKIISKEIRHESERLSRPLTPEQQFDSLRHIAELNWELVYAGLAQGELRKHILGQARQYADAALALDLTPGSGIVFLLGRILLEQGDQAGAQKAIEQAIALGQSQTSALPYLAEIAFLRRDFLTVEQIMPQLSKLNLASRTRAVEDFWVKRNNEINFSDRKYLPHI